MCHLEPWYGKEGLEVGELCSALLGFGFFFCCLPCLGYSVEFWMRCHLYSLTIS